MSRKQKRMGPVGCFGQIENIKRQSLLYSVAPDESAETGRQQKENFTKPKWKNYDVTMFCPVLLPLDS